MSAIIIAKVAALLDRRLAVRILSVPLDKFVIVDRNNSFMCFQVKFRFGSLAVITTNISRTAALGWKADLHHPISLMSASGCIADPRQEFSAIEIGRCEALDALLTAIRFGYLCGPVTIGRLSICRSVPTKGKQLAPDE